MDGLRQRGLLRRPHLDRTALKFSFEVHVHSLDLKPHVRAGSVSVLWTRGSKAASTAEVAVGAEGRAVVEEKLCLLCTLFRDESKQSYDRKLCTFTVVQRPDIKLGRASIDLAEHAAVQTSGDGDAPFEVSVQRGGIVVGTLRVSIASRWLQSYRRHGLRAAGAHGAGADVSSVGSGSAGAGGGLSDDDDDDDTAASESESDGGGSEAGLDGVEEGHLEGQGLRGGSTRLSCAPAYRRPSPRAAAPSLFASAGSLQLPPRRERSATSDGSHATSHAADAELQSQLAEERATRRALEAELSAHTRHASASQAQRHARVVELRRTSTTASATGEAARQAEQTQALRERLAEAEARHAAAEERWRDELGKVRREKETALAELRQMAAEREAQLAGELSRVEETFGERLARAEEQKMDVSRRLGKTARSKESIISQLEAEKTMLELRADALENELCEALDAKRRQSEQTAQLTRRVGELEAELREAVAEVAAAAAGTGGGAAPAARAPADGRPAAALDASELEHEADSLLEELSVSTSVRDALRDEMAKLERELVGAKLALAQAEEEKAQLRRQLKASRARQLAVAERMTELEVRLARSFDESSATEERIAEAFSGVIRDLEEQLRAAHAAHAR